MSLRALVLLPFLLLACGDDDTTPTPDAAQGTPDAPVAMPDAAPNPVSEFNYAGGPVSAMATRTINGDGSETLHGETVWDFGAALGVQMRVLEDVELDATGVLVSADAHYWTTIGTTELRRRIVFDPAAGEVRITRDGGVIVMAVPSDAPWVYAHFVSDAYFRGKVETPVAMYAFARATAQTTVRGIDYDFQWTWTFPGANAITGMTGNNTNYDYFGSPMVMTPDFVLSWTMVFFDTPVSTVTDSWGDLLDFTVAEGTTTPLTPPDCTITTGTEEAVTITSADGAMLSGVVNVPAGAGPFPYVVLVEGWGGCDRDCVRSQVPSDLCIAKDLVEAGIGVLRVDDRGSTPSAPPWHARLQSYVDDTIAKAEYVAARADVDPNGLVLMSYRIGDYSAAMAAAAVPEVDGLVVMNGFGTTIALLEIEAGSAAVASYGGSATLDAIVRDTRQNFVNNVAAGPDSFLKDLHVADAPAALVAADLPTLLLQSDNSWYPPPGHAELLETALTTAGNTNVTTMHFANAGWELQLVPAGMPPAQEIFLPTSHDPAITAAAITWIQGL